VRPILGGPLVSPPLRSLWRSTFSSPWRRRPCRLPSNGLRALCGRPKSCTALCPQLQPPSILICVLNESRCTRSLWTTTDLPPQWLRNQQRPIRNYGNSRPTCATSGVAECIFRVVRGKLTERCRRRSVQFWWMIKIGWPMAPIMRWQELSAASYVASLRMISCHTGKHLTFYPSRERRVHWRRRSAIQLGRGLDGS
jgi:hypothetical protein